MHRSWHTWDPEVVYFLWFSFVLSLLGNVSFPIMGTNTLFLLEMSEFCTDLQSLPWLCLSLSYCARNSKAAFRAVERGRDSVSCERHCTTFKQKKCPHNTRTHAQTHSIASTFTPSAPPPECICLHEHNHLLSEFATGVKRASYKQPPFYWSIITNVDVFSRIQYSELT